MHSVPLFWTIFLTDSHVFLRNFGCEFCPSDELLNEEMGTEAAELFKVLATTDEDLILDIAFDEHPDHPFFPKNCAVTAV